MLSHCEYYLNAFRCLCTHQQSSSSTNAHKRNEKRRETILSTPNSLRCVGWHHLQNEYNSNIVRKEEFREDAHAMRIWWALWVENIINGQAHFHVHNYNKKCQWMQTKSTETNQTLQHKPTKSKIEEKIRKKRRTMNRCYKSCKHNYKSSLLDILCVVWFTASKIWCKRENYIKSFFILFFRKYLQLDYYY